MARELSAQATISGASFEAVLRCLLAGGWEARDVKGVTYLPEGAVDPSEWEMFSDVTAAQAIKISTNRAQQGLTAGIVLLRQGEDRGGSFLWFDDGTLVVTLNVNPGPDCNFNQVAEEVGRTLEMGGIAMERFVVERC